ncbi:carboxypeptidase-like regulatory domain-containing protein [Halomonas sp. DN3]|uniref:carboxypeptidase-like regulatory domain-containing protein n=1 Tax=Halomonas sp. DN3 TaxID=2953657 RepID=UPI00209CF4A1|nr:carboxypeptidase-like regulatory domain-containing protein [Halomonas sp. DN3]USZ50447.1 carboxypeptidase-like regulatory domain-containing protein [Halomonas sp. DN3]
MRLATGGRRSISVMAVLALMLALMSLVSGCVPVISERWARQPLQGQVIDVRTGAPLAGARVSAEAFAEAAGVTDSNGRFAIPGHSYIGGQLLMAASGLRPQCWKVERDGYRTLWIEVMEMVPDTLRQPITVNLPMLTFDAEAPAERSAETMVKEKSTGDQVGHHVGNHVAKEAISRAIQYDNYRWRLAEGSDCGAAPPPS